MKRSMSGDLHRLTNTMSPFNPVETWNMSSLVKFPMSRRQSIFLPRTNVVKLLSAIQSGPLFQSFGPPTLIVIGIRFFPLALDIYGGLGPSASKALAPISDQIAKIKGTCPSNEQYRIMLSLSSLVTQKTALAINRRQLDLSYT